MDPARMFMESLTPRPELENSQGQNPPYSGSIVSQLPPAADMPAELAWADYDRLHPFSKGHLPLGQGARAAPGKPAATFPSRLRRQRCHGRRRSRRMRPFKIEPARQLSPAADIRPREPSAAMCHKPTLLGFSINSFGVRELRERTVS
jgi:hypothetical protein